MGNTSTKESRGASPPPHHQHRNSRSFSGPSSSAYAPDMERAGSSSLRLGRRHRGENFEAALLGLNLAQHRDRERERERDEGPYKTREERRAEKEAERRKEREKERERSMAEESVDGGYLVTVGVYTGPEDYNLKVVRQLQIERRLAPFWKGIPDHESDWTDAQLVAAAQGKDIPDADAAIPPSPTKPANEDLNRLTVPMATRSRSQSSSSSNSAPVETNIPSKTVNNRPIEAVLYENASECPICFLYYPPHLNRTRCCDQPICSECFVQIKRADPHIPEHSPPGSPAPQPVDQDRRAHAGDQLISEPASCPFCKQPEFGVVFTALPWRRGLVYANQTHPYGIQQQSHLSHSSNTSSTSSLPVPGTPNRKKTSYAVNAPEVITTDRIRPDWATKLAHAKNQAARRAAAATALHTAAYLMHNMNNQTSSASSNPFSSRRILRRMNNSSGSMTPNGGSGTVTPAAASSTTNIVPEVPEPTPAAPATQSAALQNVLRRARMVDLEEMMLMEAIRLSLAEEEERKRKEEKEKKEKEEANAEAERAAARLATSAPEPSRMDLGKGKGLAPRVDTISIGRRSEDAQSSPTIGFGTSSHHLKIQRATSDVSSSASSMKEPEAGNSDEDDGTEPIFNFQSLAQTLMEAEDGEANGNNVAGKGKQAENVENVAPLKKEADTTATREEPDTADSKTAVRHESVRVLGQETA
ncbi:SNF1-interacting protein, variant 2 [Orbilia oligospora]|uniref:SNF1-interacting protein, variant 2 n=1 Tax=Orbilia oligospora TaxID=2813651 RepID=A0A7C8NH26_ORBOL|nr:SNF1-interacting protein, variant 2 [Orbilia oligospora]